MALKLRAQSPRARRRLVLSVSFFGITNAILPYLQAPVSFKRVLGSLPRHLEHTTLSQQFATSISRKVIVVQTNVLDHTESH